MDTAKAKLVTEQFYEWERRGRGWDIFDGSVDLEPTFVPFFHHHAPTHAEYDDSKRPGLFGSIANIFRPKETTKADTTAAEPVQQFGMEANEPLCALSVSFPKDQKIAAEDMEQLLLMLSNANYPISFEIVSTETAISQQFVCRKPDAMSAYLQIQAFFPTAIIRDVSHDSLYILSDTETCVIDLGLSDEFMLPLAVSSKLDPDPYIGLYAALEQVYAGERGIVQILFTGTVNPWSESILRAVSDNAGGAFFANAPDMLPATKEKVSAPLCAVCIRAIGQSESRKRSRSICVEIAQALMHASTSKHNSLAPLSAQGYPLDDTFSDVLLRETRRAGMLLNSKELATLVHFPTPDIVSKKITRDLRKTQSAPDSTRGHSFVLGMNEHHGATRQVTVPTALRLRHTHIIGATGTGKSTLLLSMIAQDMQLGNGCAVLDPHGDLIESILPYVPKERIQDVIIIDPADAEYPVAFNILSAHSEVEKDILSSDLVAAFKRLSTSWGDQMNSVFANAILAFLENPKGGTLVDVRRFLIEKGYRESYLKGVSDPHIRYYWQHEYPLLKSSSIGSILTRLDTFLRPKLIRNMVAQKKGLDFEHILDSKKILLVKLSQGLMGAENSYLLGTFFVSKMYQAAMARQAKSKDNRSDFFLYIDEFQNFITPSMSYILSGARKYHLGLILAHQDMQQLTKYDSELASSVVVNAGTRICFRLGDTDAKRFGSGFAHFDIEDLENLKIGEAIGRIEQPTMDFSLSTIPLSEVDAYTCEETVRSIIEHSRSAYGTERHIVEAVLHEVGQDVPEVQHAPVEPKLQIKQALHEVMPKAITQPQEAHKPASKIATQHRYLQTLIKKMAQSRGYKATIEEATPAGGRVDVGLEKDGKRIAVEISVTTDDSWEIHNVEKCLAAGYDTVIVCSNDAKNLQRIKKQVESVLDAVLHSKVVIFEAQELIQYLDAQSAKGYSEEKTIKGYRIKVNYAASSDEETQEKQKNIARTIGKKTRKESK